MTPSSSPSPRTSLDQPRDAVGDARRAAASSSSDILRTWSRKPGAASRRARHWRPPSRADCRRRSSRACRRHALGGLCGRQARADRKAAAEPLASAMISGVDADASGRRTARRCGPCRSAPRRTISSRPCSSQSCAQLLEELRRETAHAALALDRLDQDAGGLRADRRFTASRSPNGTWSKPSTIGPKPSRSSSARRRRASPACGRGTRLRR